MNIVINNVITKFQGKHAAEIAQIGASVNQSQLQHLAKWVLTNVMYKYQTIFEFIFNWKNKPQTKKMEDKVARKIQLKQNKEDFADIMCKDSKPKFSVKMVACKKLKVEKPKVVLAQAAKKLAQESSSSDSYSERSEKSEYSEYTEEQ